MTDLEKIESDPALRRTLSEMLNAELKIVECWHHWHCKGITNVWHCYNGGMPCCGKEIIVNGKSDFPANPDLFTPESFLTVFKVMEKIPEFWGDDFHRELIGETLRMIAVKDVVSPSFQLKALRWLLEQEGRGGELERVMR